MVDANRPWHALLASVAGAARRRASGGELAARRRAAETVVAGEVAMGGEHVGEWATPDGAQCFEMAASQSMGPNGGSGSYSMPRWISLAASSLTSREARWRLPSMPAEKPAVVRYLPSSTQCWWRYWRRGLRGDFGVGCRGGEIVDELLVATRREGGLAAAGDDGEWWRGVSPRQCTASTRTRLPPRSRDRGVDGVIEQAARVVVAAHYVLTLATSSRRSSPVAPR
jgi:hypothetical protein